MQKVNKATTTKKNHLLTILDMLTAEKNLHIGGVFSFSMNTHFICSLLRRLYAWLQNLIWFTKHKNVSLSQLKSIHSSPSFLPFALLYPITQRHRERHAARVDKSNISSRTLLLTLTITKMFRKLVSNDECYFYTHIQTERRAHITKSHNPLLRLQPFCCQIVFLLFILFICFFL